VQPASSESLWRAQYGASGDLSAGKIGRTVLCGRVPFRHIVELQQHRAWTDESALALGRSYQGAAVLAAAAELDLFSALCRAPQTSLGLARKVRRIV
jgi:hypothetical protein